MDWDVKGQMHGATRSTQTRVTETEGEWWRDLSVKDTLLPVNRGLETTWMLSRMNSLPPGLQTNLLRPPPLLLFEENYEHTKCITTKGIQRLHLQTCSAFADSNAITNWLYEGSLNNAVASSSDTFSKLRVTEVATKDIWLKELVTGVEFWTLNQTRAYLSSWKVNEAMEKLVSEMNVALTGPREINVALVLTLIARFILTFLAIHPFSDGNGRVATVLQLFLTNKMLGFYVPHIPGDGRLRGYLYQNSQFEAGQLRPLDRITSRLLAAYLVDCAYNVFKNIAPNQTRVLVITGTPGSGKTCLTQYLGYVFHAAGKRFNVINLDPDVSHLPYECNVDIRMSVHFHNLMEQIKSGSSGTTNAALNMFASMAGDVILEMKKSDLHYILVDAPGHFAECQAGISLLQCLATHFITDTLFLIDTLSATQPMTFITSMMEAWLVQRNINRTPLTMVFNKMDIGNPSVPIQWMRSNVFVQDMSLQDMHSALKDCYKSVSMAVISAMTGSGIPELLEVLGDHSGSEAVRAAMVTFTNREAGQVESGMKQLSLNKVVLSEETMLGLKEMFKRLDTDNTGRVTFDELRAGLANLGAEFDLQQLMQTSGVDENGSISYTEFMESHVYNDQINEDSDLYKDNNG